MSLRKSPRKVAPSLAVLLFAFASIARGADVPQTKPATAPAKAEAPKPEDKDAWKLLDGWKVEVLGEHPAIHHPSVLCPAPDGRIFMAEDPIDMKGSSKAPLDRILVYHPDTKQFTVFAEGLNAVFGLQYIDGKLYVHHTPKFSVYTDEDSVGVDRVDLIDSDNPSPNLNGTGFNDHIPSNCRLAMDGYLYISTGDKGIYNATSNVDHSTATIHGGGLFRMRPDGTGLEVYSTGTRNHLDVAINDEDEMFTYDNTDDGLGWWTRFTHMIDGGYYGYPYDYRPPENDKEGMAAHNAEKAAADKAMEEWNKANKDKPEEQKSPKPAEAYSKPYRPWTLWRMYDTGGGSATGSVAYNEDALPAEYHGNVFCSEWGKGQIERFALERSGGTYKVTKHDILLKGGPGALRPVGIQVLADGSGIICCDWNYTGWRNPNADAGRLLKITYTGKLNAAPKPAWFIAAAEGQHFEASDKELVAALSHPAESVRLVAQRRLIDRGAHITPLLLAVLNDGQAPAHAKWHAIWALDGLDAKQHDPAIRSAIIALLADSGADRSVREQAARELGTRKAVEGVPALISALDEENEALRLRAATALGRIGDVAAVKPLLDKLGDTDLFTHFAIFTALHRIGAAHPEAWDAIVAALASDRTEQREGAALAMHETYDPRLVQLLATFAASNQSADARAAAITAIAPLQKQQKPWMPTREDLKWWRTMPARDPAPPKEVEWAGTSIVMQAIRTALNDESDVVRHAAVQALRVAPDPSVSERLGKLFETDKDLQTRKAILAALASAKASSTAHFVDEILSNLQENGPIFPEALEAAEHVGGPEMIAVVLKFVSSDTAKPEQVAEALKTLARMPDPKSTPILTRKLDDPNNAVVGAAADAIGSINEDLSVDVLIPFLKNHRPEVKRAVASALEKLHRDKSTAPLLAVWQDKDMQKEAILALAAHADLRALDAYLDGLGMSDGNVRNKCRRAIEAIHDAALPKIEERLATNPPAARAVVELQQVYEKFIPKEQRAAHKLYSFDTHALSPEAFNAYAERHAGDAVNGGKVFHDQNVGCIRCHKIGNEGGDVGPSLDGVGGKYPRAFLIESILYPSKQILDGYQQTVIKRKSTNAVDYYIIRAETDTELTAVDSNGQKTIIKKDDILSRKVSNISMMPEGLQAAMKPEEFADIVAFLESLKEPLKK